MEDKALILRFLAAVAQRLRRRAACRGLLYLLAFWLGLGLVAPWIARWGSLDVRSAWMFGGVALAGLLVFSVLAFLGPRRRWSGAADQARYVGQHEGELRSDLLSSLEFMADETREAESTSGSPQLRDALIESTAQRIAPLRPQVIVPMSTLRSPLYTLSAVALLYFCAALIYPQSRAQGWRQLFHSPEQAPFGGAQLTQSPLVGDLDIVVIFPQYTGKTPLHLPSSSGDFEAMAGSTVEVSTHTVESPRQASILFSPTPDLTSDEEIALSTTSSGPNAPGSELRASFLLTSEIYYRFATEGESGHQVEARARHITIARDQPPTIELYAPADELDVAKMRRIELGYVGSDDFGIAQIELVYTPRGGAEYRETLNIVSALASKAPRLRSAHPTPPRKAQSKHIWDLSALPLRPGVQIEYHLEITDNDDVGGPNVSRSKSYSILLFSPRERHEDLVERQRALATHMLHLLSARLLGIGASLEEHKKVSRGADALVVELGGLVAAARDDELATAKLRNAFEKLRERISRRVHSEAALFKSLRVRDQAAQGKALAASDHKNIAALEEDVLMLATWQERQDLENLLGISDEVDASRERLEKLFAEYARTGSQEVLNEIEREFEILQRKLAEMAAKGSSMPEDVLDRFVNNDALRQHQEKSCLAQVRQLIDAGDIVAAQEKMKHCNQEMDASAQALEDSLRALRDENFSKEEKQFNAMMNDLADLGQDQENIAQAADEVYQRYAKAVAQMQDAKIAEVKESVGETLRNLRTILKSLPPKGLTPFAREEMTALNKRLQDTAEMLERGELAEALSMARFAQQSIETIQAEMLDSLDEAWSRPGVVAEKQARSALPVAAQLVEQLEAAIPSPRDIMSSEDRQALDKLRRRQKANAKRAKSLLKRGKDQAKSLPGKSAKAMEEGLGAALEHMKKAAQHMRSHDPSNARQQAREAATQLKETQRSAQGAARQKQHLGRPGWRDEPVRIPGAGEHKTPEKFRKEILDAMEEDSTPSGFSEQVKRYYKDIIQ